MLKVTESTQRELNLLEGKIRDKKLPARIYQRYQIIWQGTQGGAPRGISLRKNVLTLIPFASGFADLTKKALSILKKRECRKLFLSN